VMGHLVADHVVLRTAEVQERWDRAFPGLTIVSAGPVIGLAIWLQSLVPIEYFATAFVAALMQSCGAAMANSRAKFTFFAVAGL
jgi:hypothetical protein